MRFFSPTRNTAVAAALAIAMSGAAFALKDPAMLTALTPGDKIRFEVERGNDGFIVTRIENSN
jgi:Cu/Ag efflux protein CusF